MNILSYRRDEIVAFAEKGWMSKADITHYDVCKALSEGQTQSQVAEKFNISDSRIVRFIKEKCPECGRSR